MVETYLDPKNVQKKNGAWIAKVQGPGLLAIVSNLCHHCESLKKTLSTMDHPPRTYFITSDRNDAETQNLLRQLDVRGVPDIYKVDSSGHLVKYDGPRDPRSILSHFGGSGIAAACQWERWILPFVLVVVFVLAIALSR